MGRKKRTEALMKEADQYGHQQYTDVITHAIEQPGPSQVSIPHMLQGAFLDGLETGIRIAVEDIVSGRMAIDLLERAAKEYALIEGSGPSAAVIISQRLLKILAPKAKPPEGL